MPPISTLQALIGEVLGQVCLDPFGVQFKFDRWCLNSQYEIEHTHSDGCKQKYSCVARVGPPLLLHRLLQDSVSSVHREDLSFALKFQSSAVLTIFTELSQYECGQLYRLGQPLVMNVF
jgi:hypothetical protein